MNPQAVGIDLGTTYSVIAVLDERGRPVVIPNAEGHLTTPSVVCLNQGRPVVGDEAKQAQALGDENVASFFKRWMGNPEYSVTLGDREWSPVELSAQVLRKLAGDAEAFLKCPVKQAVITVPAYFDDRQRRATIAAGQQAGLEVLQIINEPTAAALALGLKLGDENQLVLVYDLGGGTFDVTIVDITATEFRVLGTDGDHQLGGKDWDDTVARWFAESFQEKYQIDIFSDGMAFNELRVACEEAKIRLSDLRSVRLAYAYQKQKHSDELTRDKFQELTNHLMERTVVLCEHTLAEAGKKWTDLAGVLLVGGSSRMPQVREFVQRMSGRPGMQTVNPDHAVAEGAALCAGQLLAKRHSGLTQLYGLPGKRTVRDVTAHTLGVIAEAPDQSRFVNSPVVPRNSVIPAQGERDYKVRTRHDCTTECIVYATEGDGTDPRTVAVRGKYVCVGKASRAEELTTIRVQYAYDLNGTIQVSARDTEAGVVLAISQEPVGDLSWLEKSPRALNSFDLSSLRLVVTEPCFDNIGDIISSLGLKFEVYTEASRDLKCDILFLNCGLGSDVSTSAVRSFVNGGGCVYASDLMDTVISQAFPGLFQFAGHVGRPGQVRAEVVDPELQRAIGTSISVTFDMGAWAVLDSVAHDVSVLLRSADSGKPLMVMAKHGEGTVFYTCFHNHAQTSETEQTLLQLLVLKQISVASGVPIEVVTRSKGISLST